jgi:hypothetical protein
VWGWWSGSEDGFEWDRGRVGEATTDGSVLRLTHTYTHALIQAMEFLNDGAQFEGLAKRWSARKVCWLGKWIQPPLFVLSLLSFVYPFIE